MRDPCFDGNILYLDCINVNILVVILYYKFVVSYHEVKLSKGCKGSVYFLQMQVNLQLFQNKYFN